MPGFHQDSENRWTPSRAFATVLFYGILVAWGLLAWQFGLLVAFFVMGFLAACVQLPLYFYRGIVIPLVRGTQCPACRGWSLQKVAEVAFGHCYYECSDCCQRCKRYDMDSPWQEASALEDLTAFKPKLWALTGPHYDWVMIRRGLVFVAVLALTIGLCVLFPVMQRMMVPVMLLMAWACFSRHVEHFPIPPRSVLWDHELDRT